MTKDKYDHVIKKRLVKVRKDGIIYKRYYDGEFKEAPQHLNEGGYKLVSVTSNGKQWSLFVHRLVAKCFIPNPSNKPIVNHIDRNRSNNHVDNLEWCTPKENSQHARKTNPVYQNAKCTHCNANTKVGYKVCANCRYEMAKTKRKLERQNSICDRVNKI